MTFRIFTEELAQEMAADPESLGDWLILEPSADFPGYLAVESPYDDYFADFEDLVGRWRVVSPVRLQAFMQRAEANDYKVAFAEDPTAWSKEHESWTSPPPFDLHSTLEHTTQGFLPWQVVGFNKLVRSDIPAGLVVWDTGTGKTAFIASAIKWHHPSWNEDHPFDLALVVVKRHNKIDTQRKLKALADIESTVIDGAPTQRVETYSEILDRLRWGEPVVAITNYEKFRDDKVFDQLVRKRRVLFFWDEMPTRLGKRTTQLYGAVKKALYKSFISKPNPIWMRHFMLTATPIEQDPDDVFSCVNICQPYFLGTASEFQRRHVKRRNWLSGKPELWGDLDEIELKLDSITHRVSKDDPEVAKMFPSVISNPMVIDWNPQQRTIYDKLTGKAKALYGAGEDVNMLALIQIMQMVCDAPSMVQASAANRERFEALLKAYGDADEGDLPSGPTGSGIALKLLEHVDVSALSDKGHSKLDVWKEIITERHPHEKIVTHSTWAGYIFPVWEHWLDKWGVSYVTYAGTDKQRQTALDSFREDPSIRMFLSGDSGSDSIDIPQASVGVNYNGPWKWTTEHQREGRRDRVDSTFQTIYTYTLSMANSVEDRKRAIRDRKQGYHDAIFEGRAVESALSARMTADDLYYMMFGEPD